MSASDRFVCKRWVFQREPFSRSEAGCEIQAISKALKMCGLRRVFFGTCPAFKNSSGTIDRGMREGSRRAVNLGVILWCFSCQSKEWNSEFKEMQADDGQRPDAGTIRQTVPTPSSSTTRPLTTSQNPPWSAV
jgi:hypothetical protein